MELNVWELRVTFEDGTQEQYEYEMPTYLDAIRWYESVHGTRKAVGNAVDTIAVRCFSWKWEELVRVRGEWTFVSHLPYI